ncbi:Trichothecene biosynthesis transcription regulator TRI6 [Colletotrichum viniferum]|nr:Trichothecene biosynthesis transcription regulator TRI6 [Colletotrichum viniferum]
MEPPFETERNSFNGGEYFPQVEARPAPYPFSLGPAPPFNGEWFQSTLHPDPVCLYQPLPYLDTTSGAIPQYGHSHLVQASNSNTRVITSPMPANFVAGQPPSWDVWSTSEGSSSPAEEREEETWEPEDLRHMGYLDANGSWRCKFQGCRSTRVFIRACDLRKHYRGHHKCFFCTEKPCAKAGVGFSTRKDYQRHMGSHQPTIKCPHPDCGRIFSRKDNMREHFKKIHLRLRNNLFPRPCRRPRRCESRKSPTMKIEPPM